MTQTQTTNAQLTSATLALAPPNGFIAKAMADRQRPMAPPIIPSKERGPGASSPSSNLLPTIATEKPSVILASIDGSGKARASTFPTSLRKAAAKAAELGGSTVIEVTSDAMLELALKLPKGKIYESGRAFVPFVKAKLFQSVAEHAPLIAQKPRGTTLPRGMTSEHKNIINQAKPAGDRSKTEEGSMFLAHDGEAWFEAVVVKVVDESTVSLRWRDYDEEPPFDMKLEQLGLLPPQTPVIN